VTLIVRDLVLPLADFALDVSVELTRGTTALYGPSGAGKTTLLELIAGIRKPQRGRIEIDERVMNDDGVFVPPRHRRVGYVPQDDVLFPHLSVRENVMYGARDRTDGSDVFRALEIDALLDRSIHKLSGGERKRVALARALLTRPDVLLLDEPLSGVDLPLRDRVLEYLLRVREQFPVPTVYVTHHMQEVEAICEEIVTLERGRVIQQRKL
jgi:molybdate transport system ATP-binding protein